ncbi:hypothetical protein [Mycoplasma sp. Ms02]|uniref:hypothetical protein n=1 Tax=Mycoplasma sp. Ms02 TaxID=353851 RepID=UPI001C8A6C6C|nr:hypothetical protein [Mycoplasma sp. Ms02]QZE12525.1 hypothetical protein K4L35_00855 [Mycoplasma sp. Ms02]
MKTAQKTYEIATKGTKRFFKIIIALNILSIIKIIILLFLFEFILAFALMHVALVAIPIFIYFQIMIDIPKNWIKYNHRRLKILSDTEFIPDPNYNPYNETEPLYEFRSMPSSIFSFYWTFRIIKKQKDKEFEKQVILLHLYVSEKTNFSFEKDTHSFFFWKYEQLKSKALSGGR